MGVLSDDGIHVGKLKRDQYADDMKRSCCLREKKSERKEPGKICLQTRGSLRGGLKKERSERRRRKNGVTARAPPSRERDRRGVQSKKRRLRDNPGTFKEKQYKRTPSAGLPVTPPVGRRDGGTTGKGKTLEG